MRLRSLSYVTMAAFGVACHTTSNSSQSSSSLINAPGPSQSSDAAQNSGSCEEMAEAGASDAAADGGSGTSITLACLDSVDGQVEAVFWAFNSGSSGVDFPFGDTNRVSPGEPVQGQPWHFKGHSGDGFRVLFNGTAITWTLGSQSMTIDSGAAPCGPNVGCARESYGSTTEGLTYGPCAYCGDGSCSQDLENGISCPADCQAPEPTLACVRDLGNGKYEARFGYSNSSTRQQVPESIYNQYNPGSADHGPPTEFWYGDFAQAFGIVFDGNPLTYTLGSVSVVASKDSPPCTDTCAYVDGKCTCDQCIPICGDGVCSEGRCDICTADCACGPSQVCINGGACARPAECGIDWECGCGTSFGVHVDCGPCSIGTCNDHICVNQ